MLRCHCAVLGVATIGKDGVLKMGFVSTNETLPKG